MDGAALAKGIVVRRYDITPVPKPRQTRSDTWKKRTAVMRYRAFADEVKLRGVQVLSGDHVVFIMPMPGSWSKKQRTTLDGQPHTQRPDVDNLAKALLDAIYGDDSHIHDLRITKVWGIEGGILVAPCD